MPILYHRKLTAAECLERWGKPVTESIHKKIITKLDQSPTIEPTSSLTVEHIKRGKEWLKKMDQD